VIDTSNNSVVTTISTGAGALGVATALLPSLTVNPPTLAFSYQQGASTPSPQNVSVSNSGAASSFTAAASTTPTGTWLSVSPTSGTTGTPTATLAISVIPQGLAVGTYSGQITISSTGALNSPVPVPVILTVTPSTPASRQMTLASITGWNAWPEVTNAQWQGQPVPPAPSVGKYYLFYAIDACQTATPCNGIKNTTTGPTSDPVKEPVQWVFQGSGFCPTTGCRGLTGSLVFSDPSITPILVSAKNWKANEIVFTPSFAPNVSFQYTNNPTVSVTVTALDGATATLGLPIPGPTGACTAAPCGVIATIAARGYGQCTWFVANQLLMNNRPIPVNAYNITGLITSTSNYVPQQWDVLDFGTPASSTEIKGAHTAIITTPVNSQPVTHPDGSITTTYSFTIGEMNVSPGWKELPSSIVSTFVTNTSTGIQTQIYSDYCWPPKYPKNYCANKKRYAIAYYRPPAP
jgi:hypothetical protein